MKALKGILENIIEPRGCPAPARAFFSNSALRRLIVPILIEQFLALAVGLIDTMMISYAGESAVSGVALVNQLNNVFILFFTSLASGGAVVASQYVGAGERENGLSASGQLALVVSIVSCAFMAGVLLWGKGLFTLVFGQVESDVRADGLAYLRITALSFPALALYNACSAIFRSMGRTREVMYTSILMNAVNIVGNAIGIFALHAGVQGVAWPTLIARVIAALIMLTLLCDRRRTLYLDARHVLAWRPEMILRIFRIAAPSALEHGLFHVAKVGLSSLIATFGTAQIAANGVAQSFWSLGFLVNNAMGPVFITVIGQCMGAQDIPAARYYMKKLIRLTVTASVAWSLGFLAITPLLLQLYDLQPETVHLVLLLCAMHNVFDGLLCPISYSLSDGLRAAGDVRFTLLSAVFSTVVCRVALALLFGAALGMGVVGVALAMVLDWAIKAALTYARYRGGKWEHFRVIQESR